MEKVRQWHVTEALSSMRRLHELIDELTEEEVLAALELESGSQRRSSIVDRLISRAVRLNELKYSKQLKEKYHGTSIVENPVRR
jgi:hypothetical protein